MDADFGINGSFSVEAARSVSISSSTPIGLLAVNETTQCFTKFNNADEAITYCEDNDITGDVVAGLKGIRLPGVNCPVILNLAKEADKLEAMELFKKSEGLTGVSLRNGLILAPVLSATAEVGAKLNAIGQAIWATALIDNFGASEAEVIEASKNYGSKDALLCFGRFTADGEEIPCSALYAGIIAYYDASTTYGWAKSHSNRVVSGVSACERVIEYLDGSDCEARRMRQAGVSTILRDVGWRTYGFETTDIDTVWQSLDRVRTFYRLMAAILKSAKYARDREANELISVRQTVVDFMNELKGNNVILGFDVYFDESKNTNATVTAGRFYLTIKVGDMPSIRELNIELIYSDEFNESLINIINS